MTKLWILLGASLWMAGSIDRRDQRLRYHGSERKERLVTCVLTIVLSFFCGLRTWGNDTKTYIDIYEYLTPTLSQITKDDMPAYSQGIGFYYVASLLKTLNFSTQNYLLFFGFATVIPYVWFIRKYSANMVFGVFLMFTTGFYTFTLAAIKQCMAMGLCLVAVHLALERKWLYYLLMLALASLFHPYALVYLLVPLMMFRPWTSWTVIYTMIFVAIGFYLETLVGTVVDITAMMGATYDEQSFLGEGVNIFRVLVCFVPLILAMLYGKALFRDAEPADNLMFNLAMLNALIMFVGLFGTANYFARLANYFLPAQIITLPWILRKAGARDRAWLIPACVVCYLGYFIYENAIIRPFDVTYSHISIWEYFAGWF